MKKFILFAIILAFGITTQQCREHDNPEVSAIPKLNKRATDSIQDPSNSHRDLWELDPDPPVRDGQDWKQP
ncbi:hypothetical protein [Chryseobacterium sp. FH1]|uniref:hypothetical protein n=1 Tax=Chryseobacterium sp. FH1 TaxID=1233951 RepID=UPI0004E3D8B3|nr:hypothetical protein [Chryseobacterium sp. FH1]KFC19326.1 hypothetical protein IO90_08435 [Chryseobacterium sp. FH1]